MIIYVALGDIVDSTEIIGVFDTKTAAQAAADAWEQTTEKANPGISMINSRVEAHELRT